ncbi:MAG: hypothetical protein WA733_20955 [Methylocystis sp.]
MIDATKRCFYEREAKKADENATERAGRITATATAWIAMFTLVAVGVGGLQARIAYLADETNRQSQRAWVGLDGQITIDNVYTAPKLVIEAHYQIKNFGSGPALKVTIFDWVEVAPSRQKAMVKFGCEGSMRFATGTVPHGPAVEDPGPLGFTLFPQQTNIRKIDMRFEIPVDLNTPAFIGCVAYLDQFNYVHWTSFCMSREIGDSNPLTKDTRLTFCSLYNETDESHRYNP